MAQTLSTWRRFFDTIAPRYMEEVFTRDTLREVDFIIRELKLQKGQTVLDVGCGTGRHSLELSRRGFDVTGVDFSQGMLAQARGIAEQEKLSPRFVQADATSFDLGRQFDSAICLCEGAFGLLSLDDEPNGRDLKILRRIHAHLRPGGVFLLTALNGLRMARQHSNDDVRVGVFDPYSFSRRNRMADYLPGAEPEAQIVERGFAPSELRLMLEVAGFSIEYLCGGTAGNWQAGRPLDLDEMEIMVLSRKA